MAVYNGSEAFLHSFSSALRAGLDDSGVSVAGLMPGATETEFFARTDMLGTRLRSAKKADPAEVARIGFNAMMHREGDVVSGWKNKPQSALANIMPAAMLARQCKKMAAPGSARR